MYFLALLLTDAFHHCFSCRDDMGWLDAFTTVILCSYLRTEPDMMEMTFLSSSVLLKNEIYSCRSLGSMGGTTWPRWHHDPSTWTFECTIQNTFQLPKYSLVGSSVGNRPSTAGKTSWSLSAVFSVMATQQKVWNATSRKITWLLGRTFVAGSCDSPAD